MLKRLFYRINKYINEEGWISFVKKLSRRVMYYPFVVTLYLFIMLFSKYQPVKIGLLSNKGRESLLISYLEPYFRKLDRDDNKDNKITQVILINMSIEKEYNNQLIKMYGAKAWIVDSHSVFAWRLFKHLYIFLNDSSDIKLRLHSMFEEKYHDLWVNCPPSIAFSEEEISVGSKIIKEKGMHEGEYFCFGVRDANYYNSLSSKINPEALSNTFVRNPNLSRYVKMAEQVSHKNLKAVRMGLFPGESIETNSDFIFDHAFIDQHDDFEDVYLYANCKFLVTGASGIWWFASLFNKPVLSADVYSIEQRPGFGKYDIFMPILYWDKKEKRLLSFKESLEVGFNGSYEHVLDKLQLEVVHNEVDELVGGTTELESRVDGVHEHDEKASYLVESFNKLYDNYPDVRKMNGNISEYFILKYESLL